MKKRFLLFSATLGIVYLTMSSYSEGPAHFAGLNRTGSQASTNNCGGSGCHGGNSTATILSIEVDSLNAPITSYAQGDTYHIKIKGYNTSGLTHYGFQFSAVSTTNSGTQVQAGTYANIPAHTQISTLNSLQILEHSQTLTAVNDTFDVEFDWVAPGPGTGNVNLYCTLNAVNNSNSADNQDVSQNVVAVLPEMPPASVASLSQTIGIKAYPNPVGDQFQLQLNNADKGTYQIKVYDMAGKVVMNNQITIGGANYQTSINTSQWPAGLYGVQIIKDGAQRVLPVIKQ